MLHQHPFRASVDHAGWRPESIPRSYTGYDDNHARGDDHGFYAGLERRVDDLSKVRRVVGRDILCDPSGLLGLVVGLRVAAADVPED
jgi:hypothetical protein